MPNKDGTGPNGKGPKTGRQEGKCADAKPIARGNGQGCRGQNRRNGRGCN
jgi:hypothetical protein